MSKCGEKLAQVKPEMTWMVMVGGALKGKSYNHSDLNQRLKIFNSLVNEYCYSQHFWLQTIKGYLIEKLKFLNKFILQVVIHFKYDNYLTTLNIKQLVKLFQNLIRFVTLIVGSLVNHFTYVA